MKRKKFRRSKEYEQADRETRFEVYRRDGGKCILCEKPARDIHEIIPRSELGNDKIDILFAPKNRCCLCRSCHQNQTRRQVLKAMMVLYNYDYNTPPWDKYLGD